MKISGKAAQIEGGNLIFDDRKLSDAYDLVMGRYNLRMKQIRDEVQELYLPIDSIGDFLDRDEATDAKADSLREKLLAEAKADGYWREGEKYFTPIGTASIERVRGDVVTSIDDGVYVEELFVSVEVNDD